MKLLSDNRLRNGIRDALANIYDLERLLGRVATGRASPRDLRRVGWTLAQLPKLKALLTERRSERLNVLEQHILLCESLRDNLLAALKEDCPLHLRDGGFICDGFDSKLDELRNLASGGKQWIAQYQADQIALTGITSLKVGYTKVFGYYLEVTNTHRDKIPPHFIRKQTLKNAERYITEELKEYETKVIFG